MKYRMLALLSAMAVLLSGCQFLIKNSYHASSKHSLQAEETQPQEETVYFTVYDYGSMMDAVKKTVDRSASKAVLTLDTRTYAGDYQKDYQQVREEITHEPDNAYLLESISAHTGGIAPHCELNLLLCYRRTRADLDTAIEVNGDENEVMQIIYSALESYADHLLLHFSDGAAAAALFTPKQLNQKARTYYQEHMTSVMSQPYITRRMYPETGDERLFELEISYPLMNNGLDIKTMQSSVSAIMDAAQTYVQDYATDQEKAMMLYSFLAARLVTVRETTSTTPAYDMLICGAADSRAFSAVYKAMCDRVEVSCLQLDDTKTAKDGQKYTWNILELSTGTWHVDPLWDAQNGYRLQLLTDAQMSGYEWDYALYPACSGATELPPEAEGTQAEGTTPQASDEP